MSKYIIKNCPSYHTFYPDTGAEPFSRCDTELPYKKCQDCTDCAMKQIVGLCQQQSYFVRRFPNSEYSDAVVNSKLAQEILQLLDIQEVK